MKFDERWNKLLLNVETLLYQNPNQILRSVFFKIFPFLWGIFPRKLTHKMQMLPSCRNQ